jgi:hypothetical protein
MKDRDERSRIMGINRDELDLGVLFPIKKARVIGWIYFEKMNSVFY